MNELTEKPVVPAEYRMSSVPPVSSEQSVALSRGSAALDPPAGDSRYVAAKIVSGTGHRIHECAVRADATLLDIVTSIDLDCVSHVLVEDDEGRLIGIVETETLLRRLGADNLVERSRWEQMPVESVLEWKTSPIHQAYGESGKHRSLPIECTAVMGNGGISALVSDDDVFVSWQAVRRSLNEAMTDSVTDLPNRLTFDRRLLEEISRAFRDGHSIGVILFDVDHFKQVNDAYGHAVGDAALLQVATTLQQQLRSYDVLARYGGDEFVAICCGCGPGKIGIPLNRVLRQMRGSFARTAVEMPPVTLSIGAAVVHRIGESDRPEDLLELADMCLYRSKENGRDCAFTVELPSLTEPAGKPQPLSNEAAEPTSHPLFS